MIGSLPEGISSCQALTKLALTGNRLSGELPEWIEKLLSLEQLMLDRNQLSGPIPSSIGKCTRLSILMLHMNKFSGEVPMDSVMQLHSLEEFGIDVQCDDSTGLPHDGKLTFTSTGRLAFKEHYRRPYELKVHFRYPSTWGTERPWMQKAGWWNHEV